MTLHASTRTDIRIGIVGCGRAAMSLHLPALRRIRGATVTALCDVECARLTAAAAACPGATPFADVHALLADGRVDLVAVCVPVAGHAEVATASLQAGKHVFIEKPLTLTTHAADRLVEAARHAEARGIRSVVGFNLRSHRLVGQARRIARSGRLGRLEMVRTLWTADWTGGGRPAWHPHRAQGGGALFEIGAHQADLWRWLTGSEVERLHALSRSVDFDDQTAVCEARMSDGVLVSAGVSQHTVSHNTIELLGDRGSLRLSCYHADSLEVFATGGPRGGAWRRLGPLLQRMTRMSAALGVIAGGGDFHLSYRRQWEHVLQALRTGGPMPATAEDGRRALHIVAAAQQSVQEGTAVTLTPDGVAAPVSAA